MAFGYSPKYQPETPLSAWEGFSSRTDNGRGLILRVITKTHEIICLSCIPFHGFNAFDVTTYKEKKHNRSSVETEGDNQTPVR